MLFPSFNQRVIQVPIACLTTVLGFIIWGFLSAKFFKRIFIGRKYHLTWIFLFSFLWAPIIYIPLHYITQGYITSGDNLLSIWLFQIPTNIFAIYVYYKILIQRVLI